VLGFVNLTGERTRTGEELSRTHIYGEAKMMKQHPLDDRFKHLKLSVVNDNPHITVVAIDRPKKRNAISAALWIEIGEVFSMLGKLGDGCRCIVLKGSGKAFSSGLDIFDQSLLPGGPSDDDDAARRGLSFLPQIKDMQRCFSALEECPVPVIAAIHGNCIGAGIDLACCCDVRIAERNARFSVREARIGLAADIGTLQRLPKVCGCDSRVRELCYTGEDFDCHEAARIGFVSRVCQDALEEAIRLAKVIAANSPIAVLGTKQSLIYSRDHSVSEGLDHIAIHNALALQTHDLEIAATSAATGENPSYKDLPLFSRL
jgi:delta(3,5)-delta(2,4)-dienoyl-CoA isomerase